MVCARDGVQVQVVGPLAPHVGVFAGRLERSGYTPLTMVTQYRLMAHLSRWLAERGLGAADLTGTRVDEFLVAQRAGGYGHACTVRGLDALLGALRDEGLAPAAAVAVPGSAREVLLARFRVFLLQERGLAPSTSDAYVARADRFLGWVAPDADLSGLVAADVTGAVVRESGSVSVGAVQFFVAALRAFLRYVFVEGLVTADLRAAALAVTGRRRADLPCGVGAGTAGQVLAACDRGTAMGRRDYAVILLLARLGLRSAEVAGLTLDDFDWRAGRVTVTSKGQRREWLPLPDEVGEAIVDYLRHGRPAAPFREVFLRSLAPVGPLGRGGIGSLLRRACTRAGVPAFGPHRLRHALATEMVNSGVGLAAIAAVLRHQNLTSTAIYARVDVVGLRELAQPWPIEVTR